MKSSGKFERALLKRMVQALQPDFAAVVCGPGDALVFAAEPSEQKRKPNPKVVGKVVESGEPFSESNKTLGILAVPYLDGEGAVDGVMYLEVKAPRRLKNIDYAILQKLRKQIEERANSQKRTSQPSGQSLERAQKSARATLDIILRVLKPERASIFARNDGNLTSLAAQEQRGEPFTPAPGITGEMLESLISLKRASFLHDAQSEEEWNDLGVSQPPPGESRSVACCPLKAANGSIQGLILLDSPTVPDLFDGSELLILERLAGSLENELAWLLNANSNSETGPEESGLPSLELIEPESVPEPLELSEPTTEFDSEPEPEPEPSPDLEPEPVLELEREPKASPRSDEFDDYPDDDLESLLDVVGSYFTKADQEKKESQAVEPESTEQFLGIAETLPYKPDSGKSLTFSEIAANDPQSLFPSDDASETATEESDDSDVITVERELEEEISNLEALLDTTEDLIPPVGADEDMLARDREKLEEATSDSTIEVTLEAAIALRDAMRKEKEELNAPTEDDESEEPSEETEPQIEDEDSEPIAESGHPPDRHQDVSSWNEEPPPTPEELVASLTLADLEPDDSLTLDSSEEQPLEPENEEPTPLPAESLSFGDFENDDPLANFPEIEPSLEIEPLEELEPEPELLPEPSPKPVLQTEILPEPTYPAEFEPAPESEPEPTLFPESQIEPESVAKAEPIPEPVAEPEPEPEVDSFEADSAESLFLSPELPQSVQDISSKLDKLQEEPSEPDILQNLLKSESPLQKKKPLPDDDILKSLLKPDPPRPPSTAQEDSLNESDTDEGATHDFPSEETVARAPQTGSQDPSRKSAKPSFIKRAWKFFWPFGGDENTYLTPVTISGEVFVEGEDLNANDPIEVILFFPSQNMRVVLQLKEQETQYFYSGNFTGDEPPLVSVRVQKKGYFPAKISRVKLFASEDGFKAELNPIELLSR